MGMMLMPICNCPAEFSNITVGEGFSDINTSCYIPFICYECKAIFSKKGVYKMKKCPKCKRKTSPLGMISASEIELPTFFELEIDDESVYYLEDKKYMCPNCNKDNLRFEVIGLWD